jgi:hypothetical protein
VKVNRWCKVNSLRHLFVLRLVDSITPSIARSSRPHPSPLPNWARSKSSVPVLPIWENGLGDEGENLGINKSIVLRVFATILDNVYQTGRKVTEEFKQTLEIGFNEYLPKWNYTAKP